GRGRTGSLEGPLGRLSSHLPEVTSGGGDGSAKLGTRLLLDSDRESVDLGHQSLLDHGRLVAVPSEDDLGGCSQGLLRRTAGAVVPSKEGEQFGPVRVQQVNQPPTTGRLHHLCITEPAKCVEGFAT